MNKHDFVTQFVLNRCLHAANGTDGKVWAEQALIAWKIIDNDRQQDRNKTSVIFNTFYNHLNKE